VAVVKFLGFGGVYPLERFLLLDWTLDHDFSSSLWPDRREND